jgi:hypothetical protein
MRVTVSEICNIWQELVRNNFCINFNRQLKKSSPGCVDSIDTLLASFVPFGWILFQMSADIVQGGLSSSSVLHSPGLGVTLRW